MPSDSCKLAIVTAMKGELAAVRAAIPDAEARGVLLLCCGIGWEAAMNTTRELAKFKRPPALICSSGYCGGLSSTLEVGDIVIPDTILGPFVRQSYSCGDPRLEKARVALKQKFRRVHSDPLISVTEMVGLPSEKRALAKERGAVAVDMESYSIASSVNAGGSSVFALRAVCDSVNDELPADIGGLLNKEGGVKVARVTRFLLRRPGQIKTLWMLKSRADAASKALTAAWKIVLPGLLQQL